MFFVATAAPEGQVNLSPKGMDTLEVVDDHRIVWMNLSGSGNETAGHLRLRNRMTLMFCAFEGEAMILRLYGRATVLHPHDPGWEDAASRFGSFAGARQVFDMEIDAVQTSCGTGVPLMRYAGQRGPEELVPFYDDMGPDGVRDYWRRKNTETIDGYPTGVLPD
jgi:hypothetical protein